MSIIKTLTDSKDVRVRFVVDCWSRDFDYTSYSNYCNQADVRTLTQTLYQKLCDVLSEEMDLHMLGGRG